MSASLLIGLAVYIVAGIILGFACGRRGIFFALALIPLALAYELIRRNLGEAWCLVLVIPILVFGSIFGVRRAERTGRRKRDDT